jgi:ZIP family zinc transporter
LGAGPLESHGALLIAVGLAAGIATFAGGFLALRVRRFHDVFAAIAGGAMTAVALLDLLPEALKLGKPAFATFDVLSVMAFAFAAYLFVDRLASKAGAGRGRLAAASLTGHSLFDGIGVGLAFQISMSAGVVVAAAVLAHDIVDGLSTVVASRSGGAKRLEQTLWLIADSLAPLAGILLSSLIAMPPASAAMAFAIFAGFFLFIGMRELIAHGNGFKLSTVAAALAGFGVVYAAVLLGRG